MAEIGVPALGGEPAVSDAPFGMQGSPPDYQILKEHIFCALRALVPRAQRFISAVWPALCNQCRRSKLHKGIGGKGKEALAFLRDRICARLSNF